MGTKLKYPEAAARVAAYQNAEETVASKIEIVKAAVELSVNEGAFKNDDALNGNVYKKFVKASDSWVSDVHGLQKNFST